MNVYDDLVAVSGSAATCWFALLERLRRWERDTHDGHRGRANEYNGSHARDPKRKRRRERCRLEFGISSIIDQWFCPF